MYIVWNYDSYPFILCGKVDKKQKDGYYTVVGYSSYQFKASHVIHNNKKGEAIEKMLQKITNRHTKAKDSFRERWKDKLYNELYDISMELKLKQLL